MLAVTDTAIAAQNAVTAAWSLGIGSCYIGDVMENCEKQRRLLKLPQYVFPAVMAVFGYPTQQQIDRQKPSRVEMRHIVHENGYRHMDGDKLPQYVFPAVMAVFGYPTQQQIDRQKPSRVEMRHIVHENGYRHMDGDELPQYVFPAVMAVFGYPTQQQIDRQKPSRVEMRHIVHENGYRHMDGDELKEMFASKAGQKPYEEWMQAFCARKFQSAFSQEMTRSVEKYLEEFQR